MTEDIKSEYEFFLYENEYFNKKVKRIRKKYNQKTQNFSAALAQEIELLVEEDKELMKKILGRESRDADKEESKRNKKLDSASAKKTFRQISLKTHPDRLVDADEKEIETKEELFLKAKASMESNNINELIEVAKELNIEPPEPDEEQLKLLKESIEKLEKEIKIMKESVAWQWDIADDKNKLAMIRNYMVYLSRSYKDKV